MWSRVAVRVQERRHASRHQDSKLSFRVRPTRVGDVRDIQQPGLEGERQQAGLHRGA